MNSLLAFAEVTALSVAYALRTGATVELVGEKLVQGSALSYLEFDGIPVALPDNSVREHPGIRVTWPDGKVWLHLMQNRARAKNVLARAHELNEGTA